MFYVLVFAGWVVLSIAFGALLGRLFRVLGD